MPPAANSRALDGTRNCGIENIVVVQNKIDLVSRERAIESHAKSIILKGTIAENAPIIPVSAHHDVNLDIL
ncbi:MAG: hypothetical protein Ct9H90mP16_01360 [Candidatus Poseidoniales archaeon]|nr:MAG: hypothetical protein Ct9H90mP16_01360 [Candidatus Poseidoniales archaeon]